MPLSKIVIKSVGIILKHFIFSPTPAGENYGWENGARFPEELPLPLPLPPMPPLVDYYRGGDVDLGPNSWWGGWCGIKPVISHPTDPLIFDLNRDGKLELQNSVFFDLNASGFHELTTRIPRNHGSGIKSPRRQAGKGRERVAPAKFEPAQSGSYCL